MKIAFDQVLHNMDGEPIKYKVGTQEIAEVLAQAGVAANRLESIINGAIVPFMEDKNIKLEHLTARLAVSNALAQPDDAVDRGKMLDRMELAMRIRRAKGKDWEVEITNEEKESILERTHKLWSRVNPIVLDEVNRILSEAAAAEAAKAKAAAATPVIAPAQGSAPAS